MKIPGYIKYSDIEPYPSCDFVHGPTRLNWRDIEGTLKRWLQEDKLNLNPDYQRDIVWTTTQQSAFIEHILKGGTTGSPIVFNYSGYTDGWLGGMEVVDGKQRITALLNFFDNKVTAFGFYYENFIEKTSFHRSGNRGVGVDYGIVDIRSKRDVLKLYLSLNTTGKPHTEAEIQKVCELIDSISESP